MTSLKKEIMKGIAATIISGLFLMLFAITCVESGNRKNPHISEKCIDGKLYSCDDRKSYCTDHGDKCIKK